MFCLLHSISLAVSPLFVRLNYPVVGGNVVFTIQTVNSVSFLIQLMAK